MLSYRHAFHAGNVADILKHLVLVNTLHYAMRKDTPLFYLDTHAGAGHYNLDSEQSQKTAEAEAGILTLDFASLVTGLSEESAQAITFYQQAVEPFLLKNQYPGSPLLAATLLRAQDHLHLCDLHPADFAELKKLASRDRRIYVEQTDGYQRAMGLIPPVQKRAVILIDPSYERDEDYRLVVKLAADIHRRMASAQVLLWYPVVRRDAVERMVNALVNRSPRDLWRFELGVRQDKDGDGMTGSGMLVINPPWTLPSRLEHCLPRLQQQLESSGGYWTVERLTPE